MTLRPQDVVALLLLFTLGLILAAAGGYFAGLRVIKRREYNADPSARFLEDLTKAMSTPVCWTQHKGDLDGFVVTDRGVYHWIVMRGSRVVIEGPARTLELAQYELSAALHELGRES